MAQVDEVGTVEARRGRGHASAAVLAAAAAAEAEGCDPIFLLTDAADWPQRWYRTLGFRAIGSVYEFLKLPLGSGPAIIEGAMDLTPCIVQDARTGEVLTLAYMNDEALARTRETGEMWFWSRSRGELWHKGETSGNVQRLRALRYDCDEDACWRWSSRPGPACHTGERTCFYRGDMEPRRRRRCPRWSARSPSAARPTRATATRPSCWPTRRASARRCARRPRRSPARRARSRTSAWPRRPPTCSTTSPCCWPARGLSLADAFEVLNERRR